MCVCVSEEGGREGGGGGRGADTELKTKTPHVNVGNYRTEKINYRTKMGNVGEMGENRIIERKLRSTKVRHFSHIYQVI